MNQQASTSFIREQTIELRKKLQRLRKWRHTLQAAWVLVHPKAWILVLGFVLLLVSRLASLVIPGSSKFLIDDVLRQHRTELLSWIIGSVLVGSIVQGVADLAVNRILSGEASRLIAELRCKVHAHIASLPVAFLDSNKTGSLIARVMSDVEGLRHLVGSGLLQLVGGLLTSLIAAAVLFKISVQLTAVVGVLLLLFAFAHHRIVFALRLLFRKQAEKYSLVMGRLSESVSGARVVKAYCAEQREQESFARGARSLFASSLEIIRVTSRMGFWATLTIGITVASEMYLGTQLILEHKLTLGDLITFSLFLGVMVAPAAQIAAVTTQLGDALSGLSRTREILNETPEGQESDRVFEIGGIQGDVTFDRVSFAYDQDQEVLSELNFVAKSGTVTALVGASGAGKSTLTELIAAFHTPSSGRILIDGLDLRTINLHSYRRQLGVVLQETFLFDGTILENILFSRPDASQEDVEAACRVARVDEFVRQFEAGYSTVVGERGVKLSGGQRQRLSIARAILANPRIMILDEATSSLDSESEAMVQEGLSYLMGGRTTFVIAHRLSTIRKANQILVLVRGVLMGRGTHDELYSTSHIYRKLFDTSVAPEVTLA